MRAAGNMQAMPLSRYRQFNSHIKHFFWCHGNGKSCDTFLHHGHKCVMIKMFIVA